MRSCSSSQSNWFTDNILNFKLFNVFMHQRSLDGSYEILGIKFTHIFYRQRTGRTHEISSGIIITPAELGLCTDLGRIICDKRDMMVQMLQNEKHCLKLYYQLFKCFHVTKTINLLLYPYAYLIFVIFLHGQNFWRIKFTPRKMRKLRQNTQNTQ